jgi:hypothetical protein
VTVLADTAAAADAAATIVANAVDLPGHAGVTRVPACEVQCDSDLGDRPVTRAVARLSPAEIDEALASGLVCAEELVARGLIRAVALHLQGRTVASGALSSINPSWPGLARPSTRSTGSSTHDDPGQPQTCPWMAGPSPAMTASRFQ